MKTYNLYHIERENDAQARMDAQQLTRPVHALGGGLWTSLAHGIGPAFVVIALPAGATLDALKGTEPAGSVTGHREIAQMDPDFMPLGSDEEEDEEDPEVAEEEDDDDEPEAPTR